MAIESFRNGIGGPRFYRVHWGSIVAGSIITLAFCLFFVTLGNALGLSLVNVVASDVSNSLKTFSFLFSAITLVGAFLIGGYCTARIGSLRGSIESVFYGVATWAVAGVFTVVLGIFVSSVFATILAGVGPNAANWLVFAVCGFGALASIVGARVGSRLEGRVSTVEEEDQIRAA